MSDIEYRIYSSDRHADLFAIVDAIDYQWALRWKWSPKWSRGDTKVYLRRVFQETTRIIDLDGNAVSQRKQMTIWLHREICWRRWGPPPTPEHTMCDHRNGDELDCRRKNLRWATPQINAQNINQNSRSMARRLGL